MAQKQSRKVDKTILDNFYKLVHTQEDVRLRASASTFKILATLDKNKFNDNLNYCIERLVTGLSSSRAQARRGFGVLLLEILKCYQITTERLLTIAHQKFGPINKDASLDNLLGYYILIVIILESDNYKKSKANMMTVEKLYKLLVQLRSTKSYFDYAVSKSVTDHYETFYGAMIEDIPRSAFDSDMKLSTFQTLVIILCHKKEPIKDFLNISSAKLMEFCLSISDERLRKKPLHPLFVELGSCVAKHFPQHFENTYREVLFARFFKPNHNDLASAGLEITSNLIRCIDDVSIIKMLLDDHIVRLLITSSRARNTLKDSCVKFMISLRDTFKEWTGNAIDSKSVEHFKQYAILERLTTSPGSLAFDEDSKTNSIDELLKNSTKNVAIKHVDRLMSALQRTTKNSAHYHSSIARQIITIISRPDIHDDPSYIMTVTKYLLVNCLFKIDRDCQNEPLWSSESILAPTRNFENSSLTHLRNAYHSALNCLVSAFRPAQRIELMFKLIWFIDKLTKSEFVSPIEVSDEGDVRELWLAYTSHLAQYQKMIKKENDPKQLYPITSIFLLYGLQVIEHQLDCKNQIEELLACAQGALDVDSNDGSWADVTTDQIIALLSATECNPWIRKLCESIFGSLLPHISQASIDVLCDALTSNDHDENEDAEDEESDNDDDDDDDDDDDVDIEIMSSSEIEEEQDKMDLDEDSNKDVSSELVSSKADANDENSDDEEEEYLSDEQMLKMDKMIGDMFRLNRVRKKRGNDSYAFRLRCLDLVRKIIMKRSNDPDTIDTILDSLLPLAMKSRKSRESAPISDKICRMLKKMPGKQKYPKLVDFIAKQNKVK